MNNKVIIYARLEVFMVACVHYSLLCIVTCRNVGNFDTVLILKEPSVNIYLCLPYE